MCMISVFINIKMKIHSYILFLSQKACTCYGSCSKADMAIHVCTCTYKFGEWVFWLKSTKRHLSILKTHSYVTNTFDDTGSKIVEKIIILENWVGTQKSPSLKGSKFSIKMGNSEFRRV